MKIIQNTLQSTIKNQDRILKTVQVPTERQENKKKRNKNEENNGKQKLSRRQLLHIKS